MNYVFSTASTFQAFFKRWAGSVTYTVAGGSPFTVKAFIRGLKEDDVFREAMQQDNIAIVDAAEFTAITGELTPRRLDRLNTARAKFTVEAWHGAPNNDTPTFYKILIRGGQQ